ncbi:hypothetical protein APY94_00160 [Thermococcus celericrescens]|uniref:C2H2-type domain-containing protein n=1 Tax=Thermococcus celericrescens TaxID=227598 RepID=A0A117IUN4_9EURY|nr:hypothetical protein [Thermococcus celericrescens]KUH34824.1 hypothetical protein APY94_00160 [Thermococcus celericrescens]
MFLHIETGLASKDYDILTREVRKRLGDISDKMLGLGFSEDLTIDALIFKVPDSARYYCKLCLETFEREDEAREHAFNTHSPEDAPKLRNVPMEKRFDYVIGRINII